MSNKIKYGLKNVHYATFTDVGNVRTYGTPVKLPGGVSLTMDPKGEKVEFYADDMLYFSAESNQGYEGSLEVALLHDQFRKDVLGYKEDANGALFEDASVLPKQIALLFEFAGDANAVRHVFYEVTVSRPSISSQTKGAQIEVQPESMDMVASPAANTGYVKAKMESAHINYATFFDEVYVYVPVA